MPLTSALSAVLRNNALCLLTYLTHKTCAKIRTVSLFSGLILRHSTAWAYLCATIA